VAARRADLSVEEKINREGREAAKSRESWVKKNRIHSLLGALGVLAVQI
jgi:hypothetical protein